MAAAMTEGAGAPAQWQAKPIATPRLLAFASNAIPQAALLLVAGVYLPPLYTVHVGISLAVYSYATALVRVVDLSVDPILGWIMDRTRWRLGRFRPWFLIGVPVSMLGAYELLNPPHGAGVAYLATWYLVMWLGLSLLTLSHASWAASLSANYHERSRIYGWLIALTPIGSVGILMLPLFTHGQIVVGKANSYHPISLIILAAIPLTAMLTASFTPERPAPETERQRFGPRDYWSIVKRPTMMRLIIADLFFVLGPGVTGPLYNFFFGQIKGFRQEDINFLLIGYTGAALLGGLAWSRLAQVTSKHRALQIASLSYMVAQSSLMAVPKGLFVASFVGMVGAGFCASAFILLVRAMVADYADQIRLEQGKERAGVLYALVTTTQKLGQSVNILLVFPLLQNVFHFDPKLPVNTAYAKWGLELCYLFTPIFFVAVAAMLFFNYKLDRVAHDKIRADLEVRDAELRAAAEGALETGPAQIR